MAIAHYVQNKASGRALRQRNTLSVRRTVFGGIRGIAGACHTPS